VGGSELHARWRAPGEFTEMDILGLWLAPAVVAYALRKCGSRCGSEPQSPMRAAKTATIGRTPARPGTAPAPIDRGQPDPLYACETLHPRSDRDAAGLSRRPHRGAAAPGDRYRRGDAGADLGGRDHRVPAGGTSLSRRPARLEPRRGQPQQRVRPQPGI